MKNTLVTVVEHPNYLKLAEKLLTTVQMDEIADMVAADPKAGDVMRGLVASESFAMPVLKARGKVEGLGLYICM